MFSRLFWSLLLLFLLSLPNIVSLWFDFTSTKVAALLIPIIFFIGLGRLFETYKARLLWSIPLLILSFISLGVLIQFNAQLTEGIVAAVINSDRLEVMEFIEDININTYLLLALYSVCFIFLLYQSIKYSHNEHSFTNSKAWGTWLLVVLPIIDVIGKGASGRSFPLIIGRTAYVYMNENAELKELLEKRKDFKFNASINNNKKESFIFIIGETSRRDYYSGYGYYRNTTPKLTQLANLVYFSDAISPANATVPSLKAILHLSTVENDSQFYTTKSIVSLAKEAGYKTWWLSAQSRYGKHETGVSSSGIDADVKKYIEEGRTLSRTYDGVLLPYLEKSLTDDAQKKFIVMHLYGSHLTYSRRYPPEYKKFTDVARGYEKHSEKIQNKINHYANSIAYTGFVISEVIEFANRKNDAACVIYISDHAEYLADKLDDEFMGHGGAIPYKVEVEVPLIVWCSKAYQTKNPEKWASIISNKSKQVNLEDTFFSLSDLMGIDYLLFNPQRSFFNKNFLPKFPRATKSSSTGEVFFYRDLK